MPPRLSVAAHPAWNTPYTLRSPSHDGTDAEEVLRIFRLPFRQQYRQSSSSLHGESPHMSPQRVASTYRTVLRRPHQKQRALRSAFYENTPGCAFKRIRRRSGAASSTLRIAVSLSLFSTYGHLRERSRCAVIRGRIASTGTFSAQHISCSVGDVAPLSHVFMSGTGDTHFPRFAQTGGSSHTADVIEDQMFQLVFSANSIPSEA